MRRSVRRVEFDGALEVASGGAGLAGKMTQSAKSEIGVSVAGITIEDGALLGDRRFHIAIQSGLHHLFVPEGHPRILSNRRIIHMGLGHEGYEDHEGKKGCSACWI